MNSMPHTLSDTNHIVNSSKTEQTTGARHHLQIWDSLFLASVPHWWRLMHLRTVTGLKRDADLADLLYIKARSKILCRCMLSCLCLSFSLSLTQLDADLDCCNYFSQSKLPLWLLHYCQSPTGFWPTDHEPRLSFALRTEWGHDPDSSHPELSQSSSWTLSFLFLSISHHLQPRYLSPESICWS